MRTKVNDILTVDEVEAELDGCLKDLRDLDGSSNLNARTATEYRIGKLRLRKATLEALPKGAIEFRKWRAARQGS